MFLEGLRLLLSLLPLFHLGAVNDHTSRQEQILEKVCKDKLGTEAQKGQGAGS